MTKLNPLLPCELGVAGTCRIGMKTEAACQFPRAWQTLSWREVVTEDPENYLRYELFADGNFTAAGKPELHDGLSYRRSLRANHRGTQEIACVPLCPRGKEVCRGPRRPTSSSDASCIPQLRRGSCGDRRRWSLRCRGRRSAGIHTGSLRRHCCSRHF